ncbi:MAG: HTTM domain-containing protein [Candidatus Obscuribacterales bacterium]|nr:HTTM domain-containing protein [Candidatus Obscuribacterales bacterium]
MLDKVIKAATLAEYLPISSPSTESLDKGNRSTELPLTSRVNADQLPLADSNDRVASVCCTSNQDAWTIGWYRLYRLALGLYLAIHFFQLIPWCAELFSNQGCLEDARLSPLLHVFPNMFGIIDSPQFVTAVFVGATLLSLMLAIGVVDRVAAILLWYVWACTYGRNPFIFNPALAYVGIILIVHALAPSAGKLWRLCQPTTGKGEWYFPGYLTNVLWILMAIGYTYSGLTKLASPSWLDGSAVARVLECPLSQPGGFRDLLLSAPPVVLGLITYGALTLECLFVPMSIHRVTRPIAWAAMLVMHICLIGLIDFADLSVSMILLHVITFDPRWRVVCSNHWRLKVVTSRQESSWSSGWGKY